MLIVVTLTAGTALLMWMGELITKRGIGNGISLLIFASILTSAPPASARGSTAARSRSSSSRSSRSASIVAVVFMQEGQRRIPIQYAKRMVGPPRDGRRLDLHAAAREHGGRDPGDLRRRDLAFPPTIAQFFPSTQTFINTHFSPIELGRTSCSRRS